MCGLVAAFNRLGRNEINLQGVHAMNDRILHRGPDDGNVVSGSHAILGHRRLSIVDVAHGHQPMPNKAGDIHIVFNGEIYNHDELRGHLKSKGFNFATMSDTEVILVGYEFFGEAIFEKLDGMFSVVIFDQRKGLFIVARDRYGIKPLYKKTTANGTYILASELNSIRAYDRCAQEKLDNGAVENYLTLGYIVEGRTLIDDVTQVSKGSYEIHDLANDSVTVVAYWGAMDAINNGDAHDVPDEEEGLSLLRHAVGSQAFADNDVEVGCFLSGGLDSSIVATLLSEVHTKNGNKLRTYTAGFDDGEHDETPLAKALSDELGSVHKTAFFDSNLMKDIPLLNDVYSGPFGDNAALPTFYISKLAKKDVKVLLSGDGADELFFGYRNHSSMLFESKLRSAMPSAFKDRVLPWLASAYPNHPKMPRVLRAKSTLQALSMSLGAAYCGAMSVTNRALLESMYTEEFKSDLQGYRTEDHFSRIAKSIESNDPLKTIQYLDFETYLPGAILTKSDRATMAASLEARVPFLSNKLVDRVLPLASKYNINSTKNKMLLRKWASPVLPEIITNRTKKSFTSPLDLWFSALPLCKLRDMIITDSLMDRKIFTQSSLNKIIEQQHRGEAKHGATLWSILVLTQALGSDASIIYNKESYAPTISPQNSV